MNWRRSRSTSNELVSAGVLPCVTNIYAGWYPWMDLFFSDLAHVWLLLECTATRDCYFKRVVRDKECLAICNWDCPQEWSTIIVWCIPRAPPMRCQRWNRSTPWRGRLSCKVPEVELNADLLSWNRQLIKTDCMSAKTAQLVKLELKRLYRNGDKYLMRS